MKLNLTIWRQLSPEYPGKFEHYTVADAHPDMSFLELLDVLNEQLIAADDQPVEFDHDCREGICGSCGMMINGQAHGSQPQTATCQLYLRHFRDGDTITLEPWRAKAFPVIKDLVVDRSALDRIITAGGYVSVKTGSAPEANSRPVPKEDADLAFDYATCIGCGACVAACPNASASLFTAAKIAHLSLLPQGQPERPQRVNAMTQQMAAEAFGDCSNHGECEAVCPKGISIDAIARMRREFVRALFSV
jgi:succinate dehydrogenase / fumarate reductase iron-sulfur subunit